MLHSMVIIQPQKRNLPLHAKKLTLLQICKTYIFDFKKKLVFKLFDIMMPNKLKCPRMIRGCLSIVYV